MKRMMLVALAAVATLVAGCAGMDSVVKDRALLYGPAPLNATKGPAAAVSAYGDVLAAAQKSYVISLANKQAPEVVFALVDSGIVAVNANCRAWFAAVSSAEQRFAQGVGNIGVVENAITAALGAARASYNLITGYGIAATALEGYNQNFQSSVLGVADYDLQSRIVEIMAERATELRLSAHAISYPQAVDALEAYASLCTPQAAKATVKSSLGVTVTKASPSGVLRSSAKREAP